MPSLYTEIEINAPCRQVWRALFHKEGWMYWNTYLYDCDPRRPFIEGNDVLLSVRRLPGEAETEFQSRVTVIHPEVCLQLVSTIPGLRHKQTFELQALGRDRTYYRHHHSFRGLLGRVVLPFIQTDEHNGIQRMAWELKHYTESL